MDNAPIGNTCPIIDEVLTYVEDLSNNLKYIPRGEQEDFKGSVDRINKLMEDIRDANSTLREWGNEQHNEKEDYEREKDAAELTVEELKDDIKSLNDDIESIAVEKDVALATIDELNTEIEKLNKLIEANKAEDKLAMSDYRELVA